MENRIVNTYFFKVVESMFNVPNGGMQINGNAETITDFVIGLNLHNQWMPYGYELKFVVKQPNSKNMTAILFQ